MARFVNMIRRIPVWAWLLLAATQVLTIVARAISVVGLNRDLAGTSSDWPYAELHTKFQKMLWKDQTVLVGAIAICFLFTALAVARWLRGPERPVEKSAPGQVPTQHFS